MFSSGGRILVESARRAVAEKAMGAVRSFVALRGILFASGLLDLPFVLMLALLLPTLLATVAFFFGVSLQGWMFWAGLAPALAFAGMHSKRCLALFCVTVLAACASASYVFAYSSWDSAICHWSLTHALCEGWNPVLGATDAQLADVIGKDTCSFIHMLCAPKFPATISALAAKGLGLFCGIGFADLMLFALCFLVCFRFMRTEVAASRVVSAMASLLMAAPLELMRQTLQGYVDYCRYAGIVVGVMSYLIWRRSGRLADLLLFLLGFVVAAISKSGALVWLIVAYVAAFVMHCRSIGFRRAMLGALLLFALLGFSPYVTEWIHNGSPFYPAHTFDSGKDVVDLCRDQLSSATRNPAALKMGWLSRVVYAWVSPDLAVAACKWWYSDPNFNPVFKNPFVNGLSNGFLHWLWFCALAFCFIRNRSVWIVGGVAVAIVLLLPCKYMGFYRYAPEITILPPLCLATLTQTPFRWKRLSKVVKVGSTAMLGYMCVYAALFALSWFGLQLGMEAARQRAFVSLGSGHAGYRIGRPLNEKLKLVCTGRTLAAANLECADDAEQLTLAELHFAPPETFDLGLIPGKSVQESRALRDGQIRAKPIYFSYYNSLFSPFTDFGRWKKYRFGLEDVPHPVRRP